MFESYSVAFQSCFAVFESYSVAFQSCSAVFESYYVASQSCSAVFESLISRIPVMMLRGSAVFGKLSQSFRTFLAAAVTGFPRGALRSLPSERTTFRTCEGNEGKRIRHGEQA